MRYLVAAALTAALIGSPAAAATITQSYSSYGVIPGFQAFDSSLGTLTSVTLQASTTDSRTAYVSLDHGAKTPANIDWSVNGQLNITLFAFGGTSLDPLALAISGSGSATYSDAGFLNFAATGTDTFNLDPAFFLLNSNLLYDFGVFANDPGLSTYADTKFTSAKKVNVNGSNDVCFAGAFSNNDGCNSTTYLLSYNFTPLDVSSPVPEPATWAMMLLGFFGVGMATRRRSNSAFA